MPDHAPRLLDRVRHALRAKHYSIRTEAAYVGWIRRRIVFHGKRHPQELGMLEVSSLHTRPVLDHQARRLGKVARVACHKNGSVGQGNGGDAQILRADPDASRAIADRAVGDRLVDLGRLN